MKLPPLWKLKRELGRPAKQLRRALPRMASFLFAQRYYDWVLAPKVKHSPGAVRETGKIAIYLIFPQGGVLASHIEALSYLRANEYTPIVVSNVPLSAQDRALLEPLSALIIERPNYGYDFGGYRDGVLAAKSLFAPADRYVLLNDSAWFPLPGAANWLREAETADLDFVGAATNYGHRRVAAEDFRTIRWNYTTEHKNFHYCSFALMLSPALFHDAGFQRYWRKFPLSNDKTVTVRRGEIGLSAWVISNGFSHGTTLDLSGLDAELEQMSVLELREAVRWTIIPEAPRLRALKTRLLESDASAEDCRRFILTAVAGQGVSYTQPRLMYQKRGFAFLKKSPVWLDKNASDLVLAFAAGLKAETGKDFAAVIEREALDARRKRAPEFGAAAAAAGPAAV